MALLNKKFLIQFSETFLGYGNIKAPVWFMGMEPGAPDSIELIEKFYDVWVKRGSPAIDDVRESHLQTHLRHYTKFFENPVVLQKTWRGIIRILFAYAGEKEPTIAELKNYQKEEFGRLKNGSNHCVLELFALPAYNIKSNSWDKYYRSHLAMSKKEYFDTNIKSRISKFKTLVKNNKPEVVVFYGTTYKKYWEEIAECSIDQIKTFNDKIIFYKSTSRTKYIICYHPVARGVTKKYLAMVGEFAKQ